MDSFCESMRKNRGWLGYALRVTLRVMMANRPAKWVAACAVLAVLVNVSPVATAQQQQQQPPTAGAQNEPVATMAEIRQARNQGNYRYALQQAARALRLTEEAARGYDQYELQVIRGDSLLHLGDPVTALQAYEAAAESRQPRQVGVARATALLIRRSTDLKYTPKSKPDAQPIDIVDRDSRRKAAAALLDDQLARLRDELAAAKRATTLNPILDVIQPLLDLRSLEYLATNGKGEQTLQIATEINERARELIAREVTQVANRVAQMEEMASQIQNDGSGSVYRRGLISTERQALRDDIAYLNRIGRALKDAQRIARMQGANGEKWEPLISRTLRAREYAQNVLITE